MRYSALLLVCVVFVACPKAGTDPMLTTATAAPSPEVWMSAVDGKLHNGLDDAPTGLYVAGTKDSAGFQPAGDLEGDGAQLGQPGKPAFLQVRTGVLSSERPAPPYVEGSSTATGFSPASRKIVY